MTTSDPEGAGISGTTRFDHLLQIKSNLEAVQRKLLNIKPEQLDNAAHERWVEQVFALGKAINAVRNAALETLSADFMRELPQLQAGSAQLVKELRGLKQAVDVINVVANALGVVTSIASLLA